MIAVSFNKNHTLEDTLHNSIGFISNEKLQLNNTDKSVSIHRVAAVDLDKIKDTRYNICFFVMSFICFTSSHFLVHNYKFKLILMSIGFIFLLLTMFYKRYFGYIKVVLIDRKVMTLKVLNASINDAHDFVNYYYHVRISNKSF